VCESDVCIGTYIVPGVNHFIPFQGCYLDADINTEFLEEVGTGDHYTPSQCMRECRLRGRRYAAIRRWNEIVCSFVMFIIFFNVC